MRVEERGCSRRHVPMCWFSRFSTAHYFHKWTAGAANGDMTSSEQSAYSFTVNSSARPVRTETL